MNNMTQFLPMFAVLSARRDRRRRMFNAALPAFLPAGNAAQRAAVSVMVADQQVREAERAEVRAAREFIQGVARAAANEKDELTDADLQALPTLARVIRRAPEISQYVTELAQAVDVALEEEDDEDGEEPL